MREKKEIQELLVALLEGGINFDVTGIEGGIRILITEGWTRVEFLEEDTEEIVSLKIQSLKGMIAKHKLSLIENERNGKNEAE